MAIKNSTNFSIFVFFPLKNTMGEFSVKTYTLKIYESEKMSGTYVRLSLKGESPTHSKHFATTCIHG